MLTLARWLPAYQRPWLGRDFLAALALAGLLVPEAMGYAAIAGLPPQVGLHGAAIGLLVYGFFGASRVLAVSPTSASAAMLAASVGQLAMGHAEAYGVLAASVTLMVGGLFLLAGQLRLGFLSDFISKPVLKGFVFGIAITIIIRQLPKLCGVEAIKGNILRQLAHFLSVVDASNLWDFGVGGSALVLLFVLQRYLKQLPAALVVMLGGVVCARALGLADHGVQLVGEITRALPDPGFTPMRWETWTEILPMAVGLSLVIYAESLGAARNFAAGLNDDIDPNQELKALGMANLLSGLCQCMTVGGGTSGTAANVQAGARSPLAAMVASLMVLSSLFFFNGFFQDLPEPVLAAIIIHAVAHLADVPEFSRYARLKTGELPIALAALVGVPLFGILPGLLIAMGLTVIVLLRNMSDPHLVRLGRLPGTRDFLDASRHPEVEQVPGLLVVRLDKPLFFANANRVYSELRLQLARARGAGEAIRAMVISFELTPELDVTGVDMLQQFHDEISSLGLYLILARVKEPMVEVLERSGFVEKIGPGNFAWSVDDAVGAATARMAAGVQPPAGDPRSSQRR